MLSLPVFSYNCFAVLSCQGIELHVEIHSAGTPWNNKFFVLFIPFTF